MAKLTLKEWLDRLENNRHFMGNVRSWTDFAAAEGTFMPFPSWVHPDIRRCFEWRGIRELYSHQGEALKEVHLGHDICLVSPTASGKTLC